MTLPTAEENWRRLSVVAIGLIFVISIGLFLWFSNPLRPDPSADRAGRSTPDAERVATTPGSDSPSRALIEADALAIADEAAAGDYVEFILNQGVGSVSGRAEVTLAPGKGMDLQIVGGKFRLPRDDANDARRIKIFVPDFVVYHWVPHESLASPIHIQLSPAGSFAVRILDARGEVAPLVDLTVQSRKLDQRRWDFNSAFGVTDEHGMCVVQNIPIGPAWLMAGGFGEWDHTRKAIEVSAEKINSAELELEFVNPKQYAVLEIALSDLPQAEVGLRYVNHYFVDPAIGRNEIRLFTTPDGEAAVAAIKARDGERVEVISKTTGEVSGPYAVVAGERLRPIIEWRPIKGYAAATEDVEFIINQGAGAVSGRAEVNLKYGKTTLEIVDGKFHLPWGDVKDAHWFKIFVPDRLGYSWRPPETFTSPVHIQLPPAGSVAVRVFDLRSQALPFARVGCGVNQKPVGESLCNVGTGRVLTSNLAVTDENGMCVIQHVPIGLCNLWVPQFGEWERKTQKIEVIAHRIERVDLELEPVSPKEFAILEVALADLQHAKLVDGQVRPYHVRVVGDKKHRYRLHPGADGRTAVAVIPAADGVQVEVVSEKSEEVSGPYDVIAGVRYSPTLNWRSQHPRSP